MDYVVHGIAKSWTRLNNFHFTLLHYYRILSRGILNTAVYTCQSQTPNLLYNFITDLKAENVLIK